ncbi:MAG: MBL fold metallo-hydrolase [Spirochaetia bacterium]|nr:MBL fold metallo-hydrolase [Spirochaetia bacterium]
MMKKFAVVVLLIAFAAAASGAQQKWKVKERGMENNKTGVDAALARLTWFHHASFMYKAGDTVIYFDPFKLPGKNLPEADIILITHDHYDHLSKADIDLIKKDTTQVYIPALYAGKLKGMKVIAVKPGDKLTAGKITIEAVPAYNIGKPFHPKSAGNTGYVVTTGDGARIYHAGDTDKIPEMPALKDITIALLPCGGNFTMNAEECAQLGDIIKPQALVPMHYGLIVGNKGEGEKVKALSHVNVVVMKEFSDSGK